MSVLHVEKYSKFRRHFFLWGRSTKMRCLWGLTFFLNLASKYLSNPTLPTPTHPSLSQLGTENFCLYFLSIIQSIFYARYIKYWMELTNQLTNQTNQLQWSFGDSYYRWRCFQDKWKWIHFHVQLIIL